ncbi:telomere-associated protein RIF1-like [Uloborus diversus]|uniref:telomere-associated protein RIF1-like n=1 Tax=Uloborus diversus TaxID=327109 RepID=UPI00240990CD|nr:telomere-associated protein RIF1-like [Uloborus diversus]
MLLVLYNINSEYLSDQSSLTDATLQEKDVNILYTEILKDIYSEDPDLQCLLIKILQTLMQKKEQLLNVEQKQSVAQRIITDLLNPTQNEKVLLNAFHFLIQILSYIKMDNLMLKAVLEKLEEIMLQSSVSVSVYFSACNCFQRIVKEYVSEVVNFMPIFIKMVFLPLVHPSTKVREVAGKTLDLCPTNLMFSQEDLSFLLKFIKEILPKDLVVLFKDKQELYVLKIWSTVVTILGKNLHSNLSAMTPFFQVIEKGFKSSSDNVCIAAFVAWKSLISNFALSEDVLNDSKKLRFVLKPFKNISRLSENILLTVCTTWWHLVCHLSHNLSMRFTEVCIPLLELTVGKSTTGLSEKPISKGSVPSLIKRGCFILLLLLQPSADSVNPITSPKKMPTMPYSSLQAPVDIKILVHHFKDIINTARVIAETYGKKDEMKIHIDSLMKSILFIVSSIIEDESNKESVDAVITFLNFLNEIINEKICPPLLCLKSIESLSKISRRCLVSHIFNFGSRKSQDVLCSSLLKLLLNSYLFPSENPKRFYITYNRLIQAGIHESLHPLPVTQRFLSIVKSVISTSNLDGETLLQMWSGIASPLVEVIEKTQDVNQGNKMEHDFSCMYEVLLCPVELIFPTYVQQFRAKPAFQLWSVLFKSFVRSASLVSTVLPNEICEMFCSNLKNFIKTDLMKEPHFFESICFLLQVIVETVDFTSFGATSSEGILNSTLLMKQKKPLGNLTSLVDVFSSVLKEFNSSYFESENANDSFTPTAQRKVQVMKSAAPLDLLKTFFGNIKFGNVIPFVLEVLAEPLATVISASGNKKTSSNALEPKLTALWNLITSAIEKYYLGPYDTDFLLIMTPLLEASFTHPKRNFKERSRRFWFATFGPSSSPLIFPESLKIVLKRCKLPLLSDDIISPTDEFSATPTSQNSEDSIVHENVATELQLKSVFAKPFAVKNENKRENHTPITNKRSRLSAKMSIDDLPSECDFTLYHHLEQYLAVDSVINVSLHGFVPSLYNDLSQSQDTSNIESFSDSQEVNSVSSQEDPVIERNVEKDADLAQNSEPIINSIEENPNSEPHQSNINVIEPPAESAMEIDDGVHAVFSDHVIDDINLKASVSVENTVKANLKIVPKSKTSLNKENELGNVICLEDLTSVKDIPVTENKKIKTCEKPCSLDNEGQEKFSVFSKTAMKKTVNTRKRRSAKLNHTYDESDSKQRKEDTSLKLNHSCIETIEINDSDEIIPSSQSSSENDNHLKLSFIESTSPDASSVQKLLISQDSSLDNKGIKSSAEVKEAGPDLSTSKIINIESSPPKSQKNGLQSEDFTKTSQKEEDVDNLKVDKFSDSFVLEYIATDISNKVETDVTVPSSLEKELNFESEAIDGKGSKEVIQNKSCSELNVAAPNEKDDSDIEIIEVHSNSNLEDTTNSEVNLSKKSLQAKKRRKSLTAFVKNTGIKLRRRTSDFCERKVNSDCEKIDCDTSVINETPLLNNDVSDDSKAISNSSQKAVQKEPDMESESSATKVLKETEDVCTKTKYFGGFASDTKGNICELPVLLKVNATNELISSSKPAKYNLRNHKLPHMLEEKENDNSFSDLAIHSPPKSAIETENASDDQIRVSNITSCSGNNSLEVKQNNLLGDDVMELDKSEKETIIDNLLPPNSVCFVKIEAIESLAKLSKRLNMQEKESILSCSKSVSSAEPGVTSCDEIDEKIGDRVPSSNVREINDQVQSTVNSLIDDVSKSACISVIDENVNCESVTANQSDLHVETKALRAGSLQPSQEKTVENFCDSCPVFSEVMEEEESILSEQISDIITRLNDNEQNDSQKVVSICNSPKKFAAKEIMEENNSENFDLVEVNDLHSNNSDAGACSLQSTQESTCNEDAQSVAFGTDPCRENNSQENVILNETDVKDNVESKMLIHNESKDISLSLSSATSNCCNEIDENIDDSIPSSNKLKNFVQIVFMKILQN